MIHRDLSNHGAIGILTTLVLGSALVMAALSLALAGISSRANALALSQSEQTLISTEGCAEDALLRLSRDPDYAGGPLSMGGTTCLATIQGSGDTRDILVTGSNDPITHHLLIQATLVPAFHITRWSD